MHNPHTAQYARAYNRLPEHSRAHQELTADAEPTHCTGERWSAGCSNVGQEHSEDLAPTGIGLPRCGLGT
jgi:hypothetical protein